MKQHKNKKCRIFTNPAFLFLYLFFLKKTKKKRFTINLSLTFLRTCCKDTTFSCNTKLFLSFFFSKKGKLIKYPPHFYTFLQYSVKKQSKMAQFYDYSAFFLA